MGATIGRLAGKAPSDRPALKPYWGKPAVRNFRGGDGNVGIIRSPVRAIALPDYRIGGGVETARVQGNGRGFARDCPVGGVSPRSRRKGLCCLGQSGLEPQRFHDGWFVATGGPMPKTLRHGQWIDATLAIITSDHNECSAIF